MENNEDNRQMTVIAAEIERQKAEINRLEKLFDKILKSRKESTDGDDIMDSIATCERVIEILESLLPKEEIMLVKMAVLAYTHQYGNIPLPLENRATVLFNETFKQG